MASDDSSELSSVGSLSPPPPSEPPSESEMEAQPNAKTGILKFFNPAPKDKMPANREPTPPPRRREPSPAHEYVFADRDEIAFIVMFRNRFDEAFPKSCANFGPLELESDLTSDTPGPRVENFLCALLGLILNRKQDVKAGHYGRALEDAINSNKHQWRRHWEGKSPLSGGATFASMKPEERLELLAELVYWSLGSSEAIRAIVSKSYKQNRHEDDLNQPLSVQPWGSDSDKRRYFLVEGRDHNSFRVYRESNPAGFKRTWISVAGSMETLDALASKLRDEDGGPKAKKLSMGIEQAKSRLLDSEEKRRRREYRQQFKTRFNRAEHTFSSYEGRTRGKRAKYTFSDDDDVYSDSTNPRRSTRNTRNPTPAESAGPFTTQSGRQVRPTRGTRYGQSGPPSVQGDTSDGSAEAGRTRRAAAPDGHVYGPVNDIEDIEDVEEADAVSESEMGDDERDDDHVPDSSEDEDDVKYDHDEEMLDDDLEVQNESLIVSLKVNKAKLRVAIGHGLPTPTNAENDSQQKDSLQVSTQVGDDDVTMKDVSDGNVKEAITAATIQGQGQRQRTPESFWKTHAAPTLPRTPSAALATAPLAFRGSPEKTQTMPPRHIDVGTPH